MKTYFVKITSPQTPDRHLGGIFNLFEGGDGGNDGQILGGDGFTVWRGTVHPTLGVQIKVEEKIKDTMILSHVSRGSFTPAEFASGKMEAEGLLNPKIAPSGKAKVGITIAFELVEVV